MVTSSDEWERVWRWLPKRAVSTFMSAEGALLRALADHRLGHFVVRHVTHGGLGRLLGALGQSSGVFRGHNPIDVSVSFMRRYFGNAIEIFEEADDHAVLLMNSCPYGWQPRRHAALCDAAMELDCQLVRSLGGTLVIQETIAQGAPRCRLVLYATGNGRSSPEGSASYAAQGLQYAFTVQSG